MWYKCGTNRSKNEARINTISQKKGQSGEPSLFWPFFYILKFFRETVENLRKCARPTPSCTTPVPQNRYFLLPNVPQIFHFDFRPEKQKNPQSLAALRVHLARRKRFELLTFWSVDKLHIDALSVAPQALQPLIFQYVPHLYIRP